jgi:5-(aminomethyl)-3-furanmethanol phosphate kinase
MSEGIVVKVGGSLFDMPDLGPRLRAWLKTQTQSEILLVVGGGPPADVIREMDRIHGLGEEAGHWLALRSLSLTAHLLATLTAGSWPLPVIDHPDQRLSLWAQRTIPMLDLHAFAIDDDRRPGRLPHSWDVTSDSLAARVAEVIEARELILLKSVTIPPDMDWTEASHRGFVDGYFPTMIARGVKAQAVNLRLWQP